MAIYAIADLHLSFDENKSMEIFGNNWLNHQKKIRENWKNTVTEKDLVLLPGDFSWAMYLQDTYKAFEYINELPGRKLLLKGNHDYWWTTVTKMRNYLKENNFENIDFIYNNSYLFEDRIIVGTRGWTEQEEQPEKIIKRENTRLRFSLEEAIQRFGDNKEIIVCMHYPPFNSYQQTCLSFAETMEKYNVKQCIYGHIHGKGHKDAIQGQLSGIDYKLVSSDYTNFKLVKI